MKEEAEQFAKDNDILYTETSAKNNLGCEYVFDALVKKYFF